MKITKEQEARILELDPNFFAKELELGQWYRGTFGVDNVLIFFESLNNEGNVKGYGVNELGWYDNRGSDFHYGTLNCIGDWTPATIEEVEVMLEKEARNRYSTGNLVQDLSNDKTKKHLNMESAVMQYYSESNDMYFNGLLMHLKGKWAEVIEDNKDLEIGKWYKVTREDGIPAIVFFQGHGVSTFGFRHLDLCWTDHYGGNNTFKNESYTYEIASDNEVEAKLIKEAIRRGYTTDNAKCLIGMNRQKVTGNFTYESCSNRLYSASDGKGGKVLFEEGEWAEIIPIKKPSEKDLMKEAKKRGFVQGACVDNTNIGFTLEGRKISGTDSYYLDGGEILCIGGCYVYSKGQWAEIVEADKYYKNSVYLFKVSQNGYYIQICDSADCFGIQRYKTPLTTSVLVVEATEQEFDTAYKSTSQRLKNLKND